jgi:hypothetical protein
LFSQCTVLIGYIGGNIAKRYLKYLRSYAQEAILRHQDHRFEWTRDEFEAWADGISKTYHYATKFLPVGVVDDQLGSPTQRCIFRREN